MNRDQQLNWFCHFATDNASFKFFIIIIKFWNFKFPLLIFYQLVYDFNTKNKFLVVGIYLTQSQYPGIYFTIEAQFKRVWWFLNSLGFTKGCDYMFRTIGYILGEFQILVLLGFRVVSLRLSNTTILCKL